MKQKQQKDIHDKFIDYGYRLALEDVKKIIIEEWSQGYDGSEVLLKKLNKLEKEK